MSSGRVAAISSADVLDFRDCVTRRNVLRTVPVECLDIYDETSIDSSSVILERQIVQSTIISVDQSNAIR